MIFADCSMPGTQLARTRMRGADLRGSTLTTIAGVDCLAGTILVDTQVPQLTEALLTDLGIQVKS